MRVLVYGMVGNHRGGIENFLLKMNDYMSANMIFDYVIEENECIHEEVIRKRGGKIYYISSRRKPIQNLNDNIKLLRNLKGIVETVYFNLSSLTWIEPIKMARLFGYKVVVHAHNAEFIKNNSSIPYRIVNIINKRRLSSYSNIRRLTCSKPATDFMFMRNDKVDMIYNAINVKDFEYNPELRIMMRQKLNISHERFVIGFVGRLQDQKNPLYLPDILKATIKIVPDCVMVVIGDGDMKEQLRKKFQDMGLKQNVLILGNIVNVNEYMQAMDALVLPSWHEGLPYVVVEAQTIGLKCIISDRITHEVNVTGNVIFLPLKDTADNWGNVVAGELTSYDNDRKQCVEFMKKTNFNIENESLRLEKILSE